MKNSIYFLFFYCVHFALTQLSIPCTKPNCVRAAGVILSNMDDSVSPCDDFYKFACGNFDERNGAFNSIDATTLEGLNHRKDVRKLLDEVLLRNDPEMKNLKLFHSSCINADLSHSNQVKEVLRVLNEIGDWPLINEDFDETQFDWVERSVKLIDMGLSKSAFFNLGITADDFSPQFIVKGLKINFPILWDEFEFHFMDKLEGENLYTTNGKFFKLYQRNVENDKLFTEASNLAEDIRNLKDCKLTFDRSLRIKSLYKIYTEIDWLDFINDQYSPYNLTLNDYVKIENCTFRSMPGLFSLLNSTSKRTTATLMLTRAANELFTKIKFYTSPWFISKRTLKIDRIAKCLENEVIFFSLHIFKLYQNKFITNETESMVLKMMEDLHFLLGKNILQTEWVSRNTKVSIFRLVNKVKSSFILPPQSIFDELNDQISSLLNLTEENFINNILELSKARNKLKLYKMQKDQTDFLFTMALYAENIKGLSAHLHMNHIGASPSLFRKPFFHSENPMALNYGSLGFMFAHELMHSVNKYFIELPIVARRDNKSHKAFMKKTNCVVDMYSRFVDKELMIKYSGSLTLSDDLADVEGIRLAYEGYKYWLEDTGHNFHLVGLNYTANQLFWISLANTLCRFDNTYTWKGFENQTHSHHRFRVKGMVSNSPEFNSDFNCRLDSSMNNEPKCTIWISN